MLLPEEYAINLDLIIPSSNSGYDFFNLLVVFSRTAINAVNTASLAEPLKKFNYYFIIKYFNIGKFHLKINSLDSLWIFLLSKCALLMPERVPLKGMFWKNKSG